MALGREGPRSSIAVVGVSCRLPGGANDLDKLWELLECGVETVSSKQYLNSRFRIIIALTLPKSLMCGRDREYRSK